MKNEMIIMNNKIMKKWNNEIENKSKSRKIMKMKK